jgi:cytochrome c peroxidase
VRVKVPRGLDDPREFVPASDPPTLAKWELGRRLFFDETWLTDRDGQSCATCHVPDTGFADAKPGHSGGRDVVNTPTLVNCVFNKRQFWDGRAASLEEVVQQMPADEQSAAAPAGTFRHAWGGVVGRLRKDDAYVRRFKDAFGTGPTEDAVGRAVATYLRTLLAGDSVHDRALRAQAEAHSPTLEAAHYEQALDEAALTELGRAKANKADVARELLTGYRLFYDRRKTNCVACHGGREFTDGGFHNLGVGWPAEFEPGKETGYFPHAPLGQKGRTLIGAFKTPTLRGLLRTAPYFHDGSAATLEDVVRFHAEGGNRNDFLDKEQRRLALDDGEMKALLLFLKALNGGPVDAAVAGPPPD